MAIAARRGAYVTVAVEIWYDAKTRSVHIASGDRDLPPEGLHTSIRPGTQADRSARALLAKFGKLPIEAPAQSCTAAR